MPIGSRSSSCSEPTALRRRRAADETRSRSGARFAWRPVALAAALIAGAAAGAAYARDEPSAPLPWRAGGRVGFTVDAASFPDSSGWTLEVYVRVPSSTLAALTRKEGAAARLRVAAQLEGYGSRSQQRTQEFAIAPADSAGGFGQVIALRFPTRPGVQHLTVKVEDPQSRKRGLFYTGRQVTESAKVEGELRVPAAQERRELSDLEFIWSESAGGRESAFLRDGRTVLPNPERLYGLFANELRATFVGRGPEGDDRAWRWRTRVLDAGGQVVAERETTGVGGRFLRAATAIDLSTQPAGGYDLVLEASQGDAPPIVRRSHFSIAWQQPSWLRNPRDLQDEIHFLLTPEQEEGFALLHPGEQERMMEDYWKERDPTPATAENEARTRFRQRVEYANRTFGRAGLGAGMFSDMGRTFIRYGEPSEVVHQVIPTGDETLDRVLDELRATETRAVGDVDAKGPGGDQRPFELWIYEGEIGLPPDADPKVTHRTRRKRLVFLFVDEQGLGDFRLRYSTE